LDLACFIGRKQFEMQLWIFSTICERFPYVVSRSLKCSNLTLSGYHDAAIRSAFRFFSASAIFNATPMCARPMQKKRGQFHNKIRGQILAFPYLRRMVAGRTQILSMVISRDRPCAELEELMENTHAYVSGDLLD